MQAGILVWFHCEWTLLIFFFEAFPPGEYFSVPSLPNITAVNALGDFDIAADRLAIIDGEGVWSLHLEILGGTAKLDSPVDPWRPNTPHSDVANDREDTFLRPFKVIPSAFCLFGEEAWDVSDNSFFFFSDGVHHYDEYGLKNIFEEPPEIRKIHAEMITFVISWLKDWHIEHRIQE